MNRYEEFFDKPGSWDFEVREYRDDLNTIVPTNMPPDPNPQEAYRTAVFLEGFIQEHRSTGTWSNDAIEQFDSFDSTAEVESVARALREIASRIEQ
ncbi:hypothetical protein ABNG03_10945 [Halorubrum sp. RMP-47]|uniref:Uncharacterized protein n=1 Tax=Halorubrum miltondacostae TaxID=3076378 RepID=A0ABD5M4Q6_9EURY